MSTEEAADGFTVSFKTSTDYDASLVVVRGNSEEELIEKLDNLLNTPTLEKVVDVENHLHAIYNVNRPVEEKAENKSDDKPKGRSSGGEIKTCEHGKRKFVDKGNWAAWFCPAKEKSDQCDPIWKDDK